MLRSLAVLSGVFSVIILAGCGGGGGSNTPSPQVDPTVLPWVGTYQGTWSTATATGTIKIILSYHIDSNGQTFQTADDAIHSNLSGADTSSSFAVWTPLSSTGIQFGVTPIFAGGDSILVNGIGGRYYGNLSYDPVTKILTGTIPQQAFSGSPLTITVTKQ
jgi:hypothetical protein